MSTHCALREAIERVRADRVLDVIELTHARLSRFLAAPRIAVCGLNPHAGEHGLFGTEDAEHIAPAIAAAQREGIDASGSASRRHRVLRGRAPRPLRRDRLHVSRPGSRAR